MDQVALQMHAGMQCDSSRKAYATVQVIGDIACTSTSRSVLVLDESDRIVPFELKSLQLQRAGGPSFPAC